MCDGGDGYGILIRDTMYRPLCNAYCALFSTVRIVPIYPSRM